MSFTFDAVAEFSLWAYVLIFFGGVITSVGPCNIAMIPLVIAYVGGQRDVGQKQGFVLSTAFAVGLAITLMVLGVIASVVGGMIGGSGHLWYYVLGAVFVVMGLQWMEVIHLPLPDIAARQREKVNKRGAMGALLLGLASGLVVSGCATPALAAILTLVMSRGAILYGASLLLVYGLGRGVPIVILGTSTALLKVIPQMMAWAARLERVAGGLMVLIGLYFIWLA